MVFRHSEFKNFQISDLKYLNKEGTFIIKVILRTGARTGLRVCQNPAPKTRLYNKYSVLHALIAN